MTNGKYTEHTSFPVKGQLHGDASNFYMDVDCGPHGYHKYTGTFDKYDGGIYKEGENGEAASSCCIIF